MFFITSTVEYIPLNLTNPANLVLLHVQDLVRINDVYKFYG